MGGMCRMLTSLLAFQCRSNTLAADLPKYLQIFNPSLGPFESLCFLSCLTLKYAYPVPVFFFFYHSSSLRSSNSNDGNQMRIGQQSLGNNTITLPFLGDMGTASVSLSHTADSRCQPLSAAAQNVSPPIQSIVCVKIAAGEMQECLRKGLDPGFPPK